MIRRTPSGKAKNGMTSSQLRCQLCAMAGYLLPQQARLQTLEAGSPSVAIVFQYKGTERTTELPLNLDMIGRLAWEAEFRNMSTAELICELIMGMVKKDLFPEVLGKP